MFFFDFGVSIYFFFFNLFLSAHGYSETQMGALTGTMAAGNLVGAIPAARLLRGAGMRKSLIACLVSAPLVLCIRSLFLSFQAQIGLAFLTGLALCGWAVCISPITAALTAERDRPRAFSLVFSLGIGVGAAGALAGSRMPGWFSRCLGSAGWPGPDQLSLIAACCIAGLALIPALGLRECGSSASPQVPARPGWLAPRAARRILPAVGIWGLVTGSFAPFGNVFLATHVHLHLHSIGTVFSLSQLCQVAAVLCAPLAFRRLGVSKGVFTIQIGVALCFALLALTANPVAAGVLYVAVNGAQYMGEPGIYSMMMNCMPEESRASASGAMALVLGASQLIAASAAGWIIANLGYPAGLGMIAVVALCAGVLFRTASESEAPALLPCANDAPGE